MPPRQISTELKLSGERAFNDAMKSVNSNLKTLNSDMRLVSNNFQGMANTTDALTARQEVLSKIYEQQKVKLAALEKAYNDSIEVNGESAAATDRLKQQLNEATIAYNNTNRRLEENAALLKEAQSSADGTASSIDEYGKKVKDAGDKTEDASKKTSVFGDVLKANLAADLIKSGVKALGDGIGNISKAVAGLPIKVLEDFGKALGTLTTEIAGQVMDSAAYADNFITLATNTGMSTDRLQEYAYMADLTDVSLETVTGSMTKLTSQMDAARDGNEKAAAAFDALGISVTNSDGTLRDNEAVFADAINALGEMEDGTERDAAAMAIFGKSAKDLNGLINLGSEGIAEFALEAHDAGAVLDGDTLDALGAVDDAFQRFNSTLEAAKTALGAEFAEPAEQILTGFTQILKGDIEGGLDSIMQGIDSASEILETLLPEVQGILEKLIDTLIDHLPQLLETGMELIFTLVNGIVQALPDLIPKMVDLIMLMVNTLTESENLQLIVEAGIELIIQLAIGLAKAIPELIPAILEAIDTILNTLWEHKDDLVDAGKELIKGLWQGIQDMASWIGEKIKTFCSDILGGFFSNFEISSPSRVMENMVGKNLALGLGIGFEDEMDEVNRQMQAAVNTSFDLSPELTARVLQPYPAQSSEIVSNMGTYPEGTPAGRDIVVNITQTLDGAVLARNQYHYNKDEAERIGPSLVS